MAIRTPRPSWPARVVVRVWSWVVPGSRRAEWREEWEAELWHLQRDGRRGGANDFLRGALRHAFSERAHHGTVRAPFFADFAGDLRLGGRMLRRAPGFAVVAILTIALGIGANTAVFSVVNGVMLRPLPYPHADRLVHVGWDWDGSGRATGAIAPFKFAYLREHTRTLDAVATWRLSAEELGPRGAGGAVQVLSVSDDFFRVVGTRPAIGREFVPAEQAAGGPMVAILTADLWRARFGADRGIVGRTVLLNDRASTVVGVLPPEFAFPEESDPVQVIVPMALRPEPGNLGANYPVLARLAEGATRVDAERDLERTFADMHRAFPAEFSEAGERARFVDYRALELGGLQQTLWILLGAVVLVLLVACTNVANLLLARGTARRREMALRAALGATRWRVARQALAEGLVLAAFGGLAGLALGWLGVRALIGLAPATVPHLDQVSIDARVLVFTGIIALAAGVLFSLIAALPAARVDAVGALKAGQRAGFVTKRGVWGRDVLIGVEATLAVLLLAGAGLLTSSFVRLQHTDLGFDPSRIVALSFAHVPDALREAARAHAFEGALLDRLNSLPGVGSAASTSVLPLASRGWNFPMTVSGRPDASEGAIEWRVVGRDYFTVLGLDVVRGRGFTDEDMAGGPPVMIVSESLVRRYFPDSTPLGAHIQLGLFRGESVLKGFEDPPREIVGVVADMRELGPAEAPRRTIFTPRSAGADAGVPTFIVRTDGTVSAAMLQTAVAEVEPAMPVPRIETLEQRLGSRLASDRFNTLLMGVFAGAALLLTAIGIYGVVAWMVRQQTTEIGIRVALGAARRSVVWRVIARGMLPVVVGLGVGLAAALGFSRVLASLLHGMSPTDPPTFLAVAAVLFLVAVAACWIPARRAASVDPVVALRSE